jgi:hypothetical protein
VFTQKGLQKPFLIVVGGCMYILKFITIGIFLVAILTGFYLPKPIQALPSTQQYDEIHNSLRKLDAPEEHIYELGSAIRLASSRTGINEKLLTALMYTESGFDRSAESKKGYKGLMQTPSATGFIDVDVLHGAFILKDKLRISKGNVRKALTLYKGGNNKVARKQANQVLLVFRNL